MTRVADFYPDKQDKIENKMEGIDEGNSFNQATVEFQRNN